MTDSSLADAPPIRVVSLYPDVMNVYADRGNLIAIRHRAAEHGLTLEEFDVSLGDPLPLAADLVLIGGGQDREQHRIAAELAARGDTLRAWADDDTAMLAVCGGFQLFGRWYRDKHGNTLPGVGLFDVTTIAPGARAERAVGDILIDAIFPTPPGLAEARLAEAPLEDRPSPDVVELRSGQPSAGVAWAGEVVGFENHAGHTYLGRHANAFGRVRHGRGNNGLDGTEGAVYRQAIGTYLHGSVLPKNPALLDHLLAAALTHRLGAPTPLPPLPAPYAERAHTTAAQIATRRGLASR